MTTGDGELADLGYAGEALLVLFNLADEEGDARGTLPVQVAQLRHTQGFSSQSTINLE